MKDMEMKISLICSVCGNDQFSAIDENIIDLLLRLFKNFIISSISIKPKISMNLSIEMWLYF
jgi:uncharacterized membrane protein